MTTTTSSTIGTTGTYPTIQAWFDAAPADLTVADVIWQGKLQNQEFVSASTLLYANGKTADATRYFELTTDTGASFVDNGSKASNPLRYDASKGAAMRVTGDYAACIRTTIPFTRISKMQFSNTSDTVNTYPAIFCSGAGSAVIDQIIAEGFCRTATGNQAAGVVNIYGTASSISNSIVIQKSTIATAVIAGVCAYASSHNTTFVSLGTTLNLGVMGLYGPPTLKNSYIGGCTTPCGGSDTPAVVTNCATSATASGYTTVPMSTANFTNLTIGTHDLRKVAGSALIDAGVTDATFAAYGILGVARPQGSAYDIGADEFPAASVSTAPGATLTATATITPGAASGASPGLASGATVTGASTIVPGAASALNVGTLTTAALKNNTRTPLASETGVTLNIYHLTTGALIVQKTGVTTNGSGVAVVTDALIVPGVTYAYEVVMTGSRRRLPTKAAA